MTTSVDPLLEMETTTKSESSLSAESDAELEPPKEKKKKCDELCRLGALIDTETNSAEHTLSDKRPSKLLTVTSNVDDRVLCQNRNPSPNKRHEERKLSHKCKAKVESCPEAVLIVTEVTLANLRCNLIILSILRW